MSDDDPFAFVYDKSLSWEQLAEILEREVKAERPTMPKDLPLDRAYLIATLSKHQERLDHLCDEWALTGKWPLMLPIEDWLLRFRLIHGWYLALRLTRKHAHGETLPVPSKPGGLRWLIADSWLPGDLEELVESIRPEVPGIHASTRPHL